MEDKNKLTDDVRENPKRGSGTMLAAARKQQNRSVEEIADELNLSATQIRTIELDQSEGLPEPTYVRGYIRSYAKLLGLDPNRVLDNYLNPNWQKGSRLDEMPRGIGSANESDHGGFFSPAKVVSLLLLFSVLGFLWLTGKFDGVFSDSEPNVAITTNDPGSSTTSRSQGSQSADVVEAAPELASEARGASASVSSAASDADQATSNSELAASTESSSEQTLSNNETGIPGGEENSLHELTLNFADTCWVDISDSDGKRLAYKSYAKGEVLQVSSQIPITVFLGDAKVVTANYNGRDYDLAPYREGVFARFSLGE